MATRRRRAAQGKEAAVAPRKVDEAPMQVITIDDEDEEMPSAPPLPSAKETIVLAAESPVSVLEGELTDAMIEVEKQLEVERGKKSKEEENQKQAERPSSNGLLLKLDELLTKTKWFSQFVHERMDEINNQKKQMDERKKRGRKRKKGEVEDEVVTEEEKNKKLQQEIAPSVTGGVLKSYQLRGVQWMMALYQNGYSGILADQMGLGKTVQTITFIAHLMENGVKGPFLVCAPLSTLANWTREISRWCPSMKSLLYHGTKEERAEKRRKHMPRNGESLPVIVTSYEVLMVDISHFKQFKWTYVVVDEGHRLKNHDCKLFKELKKMKIENSLLLTGTPLQNKLPELWSLLNFILPDIFSSLSDFQTWFAFAERENNSDEERDETRIEVVKKLHDILRPFLLRRMKSEVEKTLPKKTEILLYAQMSKMQKDFDCKLIRRTLEEYLHQAATPGTSRKKRLNNVCMQLRKNCNHPDLLRQEFNQDYDWPPVEQLTAECGKLKFLLDRLLPPLKSRGHRVLIFSQMTKMLDILEFCLGERGMPPFRLDGNVKQEDRQEQVITFSRFAKYINLLLCQIQKFEGGEGFVFLLSTRAGGLGINLTSADTAIIYDSDWNPQMDLQAMDRCHRIGQTRPVHVYRLATAHSVECRMLKVANSKLQLETLVINKGEFQHEKDTGKTTLDESDLLSLLRDERSEEEELVQSSEISDSDLVTLLDRTGGCSIDEEKPIRGPGWEIILNKAAKNFLPPAEGSA
ncbi:ATP-dependent DNA helicase DDM1 isoform X1 [Selaginella moellendorffii]|uniref:ATP-dependent DNA helicase DDM1 isoform X1 n=1 Tax=Selaginella moellendorffii TaxID=88036 RepID=UPI000D1CE32D|nr:ATP-dependent DNA helicase DDM1 isoform X1 [Selaginella moellendorffii]|eukprot:XP_024518149.1 ATP-dependent DNA helicase DDM1 isoform X1 [Selaginella moellendorffii]